MIKRVTVIVEGREYIVEVGDLEESPIKATVNQKTYKVEFPPQDTPSIGQVEPAAAPTRPPKMSNPGRLKNGTSTISAPMPGNIVEVRVKAGDSVNPGDVVCVLEAMKMKNMIHASVAGIISSVDVVVGQAVDYGAVLVALE